MSYERPDRSVRLAWSPRGTSETMERRSTSVLIEADNMLEVVSVTRDDDTEIVIHAIRMSRI